MKNNILDGVIEDLLSIPPLIRRSTRRKVFKTAFAGIEGDISLSHFEIMKILNETGTMHIAEIGERLQIPKPQMTHLIDRLVALEMVERQADASDRRLINVVLTDRGKKMMDEHKNVIRSSFKDDLSSLTDEDLLELSVSLRKLRDILSRL
ncbi:MarR family winged helix-turn-helix transcriptional regulator [Chloroflexota bacterium]